MKSVLLATDLIKTTGGELKVLETNTNALLGQKFNSDTHYLDNLNSFILSNGFQTVHCIYPVNSHHFADALNAFCDSQSITFVKHQMDNNSVTVPYIEDADDILILRVSYDTTAIIDEDYCRDKNKLQTIINNKAYGSKTYIPGELDSFESMEDFTYSDDVPNYIVKKRFPNYNREEWPKLYKVQNLAELNTLKSTIEPDTYLQEFHQSELIQDKRCVIRSLDLLYGGDLDVLNICSFYKTVELAENQWENTFDSNGLLAKKDRPKYISHTNDNQSEFWPYVYDVDQEVVLSNGGRIPFSELQIGDGIKSLHIQGLDLNEATYNLFNWTGSYTTFIENFSLVDSNVVSKLSSPPIGQLFLKVTLNDGVTEWDDLPQSPILTKNGDVIAFKELGDLEIGSEIITFNFQTNIPEVKSIQSFGVVFKDEQILGSLDVEPVDLYLPLVSQHITVVQHNNCNKTCRENACADSYYCYSCTPAYCTPQK